MSSGDNSVFESLVKVWWAIGKMIVDGVRNAADVLRWMQVIVTRPDFVSILDRPATANTDIIPDDWRLEWQKFYKEIFGIDADFSKVALADDPDGYGWVVFVALGLTFNQAWAKCRDHFPCSSYYGDDLNKAVPQNDRISRQVSYAKRLRNRVEADEEHKNLSADTLTAQKVAGTTLLERILLELWYHWRTGGGHLDLLNWTLCSGSRGRDGYVPSCGWDYGQFRVSYYHPSSAHDGIRARSAV